MKRGWVLTLLGLFAFLILLVVTLPARVLLGRIPGVEASGVSGSIWSGRAAMLSVQGFALGPTEWRLFALPLLRGRLDIDAKISPPNGNGAARCLLAMDQSVQCSRVTIALPLEFLPLSSLPQGWTGRINANLTRLDLERGWPTAAEGQIDVLDLRRPAGAGAASFGSYRLVMPAPDVSGNDSALAGALQDTGGPLNVIGTLTLSPDHSYVVDGRVAARNDAPQEIARSIEYLGTPDSQGRREFSLAGTL
ncbi:MAG TPA: type II secretion system protein N [Steroidobacteraceae bacterium]|nr:type II secretion system protein N [Steroidobacteraceae bacterium]